MERLTEPLVRDGGKLRPASWEEALTRAAEGFERARKQGPQAFGTATGGWRIIKTLGVKMIKLQPVNGFAAETAASLVILGATHFGTPVSTVEQRQRLG